ncbi:MAG: energy-coupling factor transporter transmembrane component T family protein [Thermodesulfobacteriota bacterium]
MKSLDEHTLIGTYVPTDSWVHRLDPRVKLIGALAVLAGLFYAANMAATFFTGLAILAAACVSRVGWKLWLGGLYRFKWMLLLVALLNLLFVFEGTVVTVREWMLPVTYEGLESAALLTVQLTEAIALAMLLTFTTTPTAITHGVERLGRPLKPLRVPVEELALVMQLAMRFVPIIEWELKSTIDAQRSRGVEFEQGNAVTRAGLFVSVLTPALFGALRRADLLSSAMRARGFEAGRPRTEFRPLRLAARDYAAMGGLAMLFVLQVFVLA